MPEMISLQVNGRNVQVPAGVSVAAALYCAGEVSFRASVTGEPRGPLCGMGICFECRVEVDGRAHCRSCQISARDGMVIRTA